MNIANMPLPGLLAIILALLAAAALGLVTAFGITLIGIPSFIMTLAMMQIGAGICATAGARPDRLSVPRLITTLGSGRSAAFPWIVIVLRCCSCSSATWC